MKPSEFCPFSKEKTRATIVRAAPLKRSRPGRKENRDWEWREVRELSLGAHAAARQAKSDAARFAARAIATWHVPTHAMAVPMYVAKATFANKDR